MPGLVNAFPGRHFRPFRLVALLACSNSDGVGAIVRMVRGVPETVFS